MTAGPTLETGATGPPNLSSWGRASAAGGPAALLMRL
jgi:hypothetical protein